jgi:hypothetical protein
MSERGGQALPTSYFLFRENITEQRQLVPPICYPLSREKIAELWRKNLSFYFPFFTEISAEPW